jgi:hypothetical protein
MRSYVHSHARALALAFITLAPAHALAATISVPEGGDLQAALNTARPGDTILLAPGATYVGNFELPVHGGTTYVTLRTGGADALLPAAGTRITPNYAPYLAKLRSPNSMPALATKNRTAFWRVMLLDLTNAGTVGDVLALGYNNTMQNDMALVPHDLIIDRVFIHGDALNGQKRGIALNSGETSIVNSWISDIKAVGQDTQAIGGTNGPGPWHIENNYLEAAGNVFLIGGDDPKIPGLVPTGLLFRGNTVTRPLEWRDPILPAPANVTAVPGSGGTLAAGTYAYRVVARRPAGATTATSIRSAETAATVAAGGRVTIRWNAVADATEYRVYGRTAGGQTMYWRVTTTEFTDTGAAGTSGTPPTSGSVWQVKNLFELKNIRGAQIDYNVMENHWAQAQAGPAILFTVRNQYGGCVQCVVEDVTFEFNTVRKLGSGIHILGIDPNHPSQQTNAIRIRNNEISALDRVLWGGNGYFLQIGDNPRDITVDHNTFISPNGLGVVTVSGPPVYGMVFTNNVARHNSYGIMGNGTGYGNNAINTFFPGAVIRRNVLAGGKASMYPADNLFPSTTLFESHFVNYAGGDYALVPGTDWALAGTDALDLGADFSTIAPERGPSEPPQVVTTSLPPARELDPYAGSLQASGGITPYQWSVIGGTLPSGVALDSLAGVLYGSPTSAGDYVFTVQVTDSTGATAAQPLMVHVERAAPPVAIVTTAIASGQAEMPYAQHFEASGGFGSYVWLLGNGGLPAGLTLLPSGDLTGVPAVAGTWAFEVIARDASDASRFASRSFQLHVADPPNRAPSVVLTTNATGTLQVGTPVTFTANATDVDGTVRRVEFIVNGQPAGSVTSAPFTLQWVVRDGGPHAVTAVAFDDDGAETRSATVALQSSAEIVIYASDVARFFGDFQVVSDATAANGQRLWNPNRNAAKITTASATPATYAEFTFYAEAGRAYHLWMRGVAEKNNYNNDSFFVQFSGTVTAQGAPTTRIGTTTATSVMIEDAGNAGLLGWGWQDNAYEAFAPPIYFEQTGMQTLRVQQREDGLSIDQIVISPVRYFTERPGLLKSDTTIVAKP